VVVTSVALEKRLDIAEVCEHSMFVTGTGLQVKGSVKEPNKVHIYKTEIITRKAK